MTEAAGATIVASVFFFFVCEAIAITYLIVNSKQKDDDR